MVYGGAWTADACRKLIRLIDLASTFHLPLVHLEDCPGFLIGKQSEEAATIRFGSQALAALGQSTTPFCCVVVRKAFGVAGVARITNRAAITSVSPGRPATGGHCPSRAASRWPTRLNSKRAQIRDAHLARIRERLNQVRSPFRSAEFFEIEEIIDPRDTRSVLCRWVKLARKALRAGTCALLVQTLSRC